MSLVPHWLLALVALQRLLEMALARRNTTGLLASGAHEVGASHYPLVVAVHVGWLAALWALVPPLAPVAWSWLVVYLALECGRAWVMVTLGRYWTTRILHLPDAPLIRSGPYRFLRHPNYVVVCGEIAVLPLVFGQWPIALVFSVLNAAVLVWRIKIETAALATRPGGAAQ